MSEPNFMSHVINMSFYSKNKPVDFFIQFAGSLAFISTHLASLNIFQIAREGWFEIKLSVTNQELAYSHLLSLSSISPKDDLTLNKRHLPSNCRGRTAVGTCCWSGNQSFLKHFEQLYYLLCVQESFLTFETYDTEGHFLQNSLPALKYVFMKPGLCFLESECCDAFPSPSSPSSDQ